jgi:hypothetical protein
VPRQGGATPGMTSINPSLADGRSRDRFRPVLAQERRQFLIDELRWTPNAADVDHHGFISATVGSTPYIRPLAGKLVPPHIPLLRQIADTLNAGDVARTEVQAACRQAK